MTSITFSVWGSRRPAPLEILGIDETGAADLLVGCAWPYGSPLHTLGTFGRALDAAEHASLLALVHPLESLESVDSAMGEIVAELVVTTESQELRLAWPPPLVPTLIEPVANALSTLARDLRSAPRAALEVRLVRSPPHLELVHRGSAPFRFYGFGERELGAAMQLHLGATTELADVPRLLNAAIEPLSDPPDARVDESGLVELRPGERLVVDLPGTSEAGSALIRICYPRQTDDGQWVPDEGWVVA